jgi:hypothetical protein
MYWDVSAYAFVRLAYQLLTEQGPGRYNIVRFYGVPYDIGFNVHLRVTCFKFYVKMAW